MSPATLSSSCLRRRFPRVSGDEPDYEVSLDNSDMFSPRERG